MGLTKHIIKSIKLNDNSINVTNFFSDTIASIGDIVNILGIDYQIKNVDEDKLVLNKPYKYIGELSPDKMYLKVLPSYIKSQVRLIGELVLITIEDFILDSIKEQGITTPGWWYINTNGLRKKLELIMPISINDEILPAVIEPVLILKIPKNNSKPVNNISPSA